MMPLTLAGTGLVQGTAIVVTSELGGPDELFAIRYTRSPSVFSDSSRSPSFLRTTAARKPRTDDPNVPDRDYLGDERTR
jgi:hypothetical protein